MNNEAEFCLKWFYLKRATIISSLAFAVATPPFDIFMTVSSSLGFILSPLHNFVEEMNNFPVFVSVYVLSLWDILAW